MVKDCIKMCDCPEIQGQWEPKGGDRIADEGGVVDLIDGTEEEYGAGYSTQEEWKEGNRWLPRQEDIQEMLKPTGENHYGLLAQFNRWNDSTATLYCSIIELWLAFYMHEIHNKTWTEKGWA